MIAVPMELKEAQAYINQYHRHHEASHRDDFGDYVELPLEGLDEEYFLSSEEAYQQGERW